MESGTSRFRIGQVNAPGTPAERVRRSIGDGRRMYEIVSEALTPLITTWDPAGMQELMQAVREHDHDQYVYTAHRVASDMLIAAAAASPSDDSLAWAQYYDMIAGILVPYLQQHPHEPELLNHLGVAYFELGATSVARRLFEAIRDIEPQHKDVRTNIKACKHRDAHPGSVGRVPEALRRLSTEYQSAAKQIAERATRVPEQRISLCMIVKDEEEMLPGCLAAAAKWVDEVIVVDTGSTDRTVEIAREYGAQVVDYPWTGSFSDARNRSVEEATGDWIVYLDADEHMVEDDGKHLRELARKPWVEGFYLVLHNFTGDLEMGSQTTHTSVRMYRNRPEYRWQGIIHEQKMHAFPTWLPERFQQTPIRLNHYGYLRQIQVDRSKSDRNLQLLLQQLEQGHNDAFTNFNIGSEYGALNDWHAALPYLERSLEVARTEAGWLEQQFVPPMVSRLICAYMSTGGDAAALQLIDESLGYWPEFTDLIYHRALIKMRRGDLDGALEDARRCVAQGDAPAKYIAVQGRGSFQAQGIIAAVLQQQGHFAEARRELEDAYHDAPQGLPLLMQLTDVRLASGDSPDTVANDIASLLGGRETGAHTSMLLATTFYEHGHAAYADQYYANMLAAQPGSCTALIGRTEIAMAQGRYDDALSIISTVDPLEPLAAWAARSWFLVLVALKRYDELIEPLGIIASAEYLSIGARSMYSAWHARLTGGFAVLAADDDAAHQLAENLEALARLEETDAFEQLVPLLDQAVPDARARHMLLGSIYLRRSFADMAGDEFMYVAQNFGPDPDVLTGLAKVATMKEMWDDAVVFLTESLSINPAQGDAQRLLELVSQRSEQ